MRDGGLRTELQRVVREAKQTGQELNEALAEFAKRKNIRRVWVLKAKRSIRLVRHGSGFTKAYIPGRNHRVEIFELPDGNWSGEGVAIYDANQPNHPPDWRRKQPDARLVMRLHCGDLIEADLGDGRKIARVYRLEPSAGRIRLAAHNEAGSIDSRHNDADDPLRWIFATWSRLQDGQARRVRVDMLGRVTAAEDAP